MSKPRPARAAPARPMQTHSLQSRLHAALLALLFTGLAAQAADIPEPAPRDPLLPARTLVAKRDWPGAVAELQRVNAQSDANWQNLMGYALRKSTPPDFNGSERHYNEALRLDPNHRGALEYSGELFLMKGDLPAAEGRLARLDQACPAGCDEQRELKQAIERYKASGNKAATY